MSIHNNEKIPCPKCGYENNHTIWTSLNNVIDPKAAEQLMRGELFNYTCKKCKNTYIIPYRMLYHDMKHNVMIHYVQENQVEETKNELTHYNADSAWGSFAAIGYRNRIVTDVNTLREKAIVFDAELDDRIIELIKLFAIMKAYEEKPDLEFDGAFFAIDKGKMYFDLVASERNILEFTMELYKKVENDFCDKLKEVDNSEMIIDQKWALKFLKSMGR